MSRCVQTLVLYIHTAMNTLLAYDSQVRAHPDVSQYIHTYWPKHGSASVPFIIVIPQTVYFIGTTLRGFGPDAAFLQLIA